MNAMWPQRTKAFLGDAFHIQAPCHVRMRLQIIAPFANAQGQEKGCQGEPGDGEEPRLREQRRFQYGERAGVLADGLELQRFAFRLIVQRYTRRIARAGLVYGRASHPQVHWGCG